MATPNGATENPAAPLGALTVPGGDPNAPAGGGTALPQFTVGGNAASAGTLNSHGDYSELDAGTFRYAITQIQIKCRESNSLAKLKIDGVIGYRPKYQEAWDGRFLRVVDRAETYGQQYIDVETHDPAPEDVAELEGAFANISQGQPKLVKKDPFLNPSNPFLSPDPFSYSKSWLFHPKVVKTFSFEILTDPNYFSYLFFYIMPASYVSAHPGEELTCTTDQCPPAGREQIEGGVSGNAVFFDFANPPISFAPECS